MSTDELKRENAALKAANLELKSQINLMQTIFDSLSEGVAAANLKGEFLIVNPIVQDLAGIGPAEGDGRPEEWNEIYGTFYPDGITQYPSAELPLTKAIRGEITNDIKLVLRNHNQPEGVFVNVSGRPLFDKTGNLIGGVIAIRDVTEMEKVTKQLETTVNELQRQNVLMDAVFNSISDGVIVANEKGEFLFFNPIAEDIIGVGSTEGDSGEWSETYGTFYPDKVTPMPSMELPLSKALRGETTNEVEIFIRNQNRLDGVFISVNGSPLYDKAGSLIGGVVTFRNITEMKMVTQQLKTTIEELQTQNALMDAIFNSIGTGIIVADKAGKYVMFNDTTKRMTGRNPEGISTQYASVTFGLYQPDSKILFPPGELPLAQALQGKCPDNVEILIQNQQLPYGTDVSISARPIYDENGVINGAVSVIHDISELKAKERQLKTLNDELKNQSKFMESIFNSIKDGIIVTNGNCQVTFFNRGAHHLARSDMPIEDLDRWQDLYEYFHLDGITPFAVEELPLAQAIQGKSTDDVELFVRSPKIPDGIYLSVTGRPLHNPDKTQKGGVIVFHDITDRIKSEEALAQAFVQGRLEIVDTILHNIGNAINSVTIGIETVYNLLADELLVSRLTALAAALKQHEDNLGDYITNDPQGQKVLPFLLTLSEDFKVADEKLRRTVDRIRNRTRHIVDIIRTQNSYNDTTGTSKDINLASAISDAIKILQDSIDKRHIQIEVDCENAPEEIRIQESQFHQMLVNLTKNAIEAIDELANSGELTEEPRIQIRAYIDGDYLCIDITDNGIGVDPEDIDKIFSAGFTTKKQGNGLGLHSSANFVISSGGQIRAFSEGKGKGTTLCIKLQNAVNSAK